MSSINLLGQQNQTSPILSIRRRLAEVFLFVGSIALVILVLAFWYVIWRQEAALSQAEDLRVKTEALRKSIESSPVKKEFELRQGQLQEVRKLSGELPLWSKFLPALAEVTLKSGSYVTLTAEADYQVRLHLNLPDFVELDKFLQVLDSPKFNEGFTDVRVVSAARFQTDQAKGVKTEIALKVKREVLNTSAENKKEVGL